ncbi:hypothetical protein JX265_008187 [Neoarthrinium moseri]|uniref:Uncharacterized protein n=1 Tax=Neoarthrinium moseri TaxID=1658444 RepID=A0A9P9WIK2_9PEZI|nr:hypothetical protein JX265_008187 [Neoarthrinium moseri]
MFLAWCKENDAEKLGSSLDNRSATAAEMGRIQRTRVFIYDNIHVTSHPPQGHSFAPFFSNCSPWENAQLGSIVHFLGARIATERAEIINEVLQLRDGVRDINILNYLPSELDHVMSWIRVHGTPVDVLPYSEKPYYDENDTGPEDIHRWSNGLESATGGGDYCLADTLLYSQDRGLHSFMNFDDWPLRRTGYVMWDRSRLDSIGIFNEPWLGEEQEVPPEVIHYDHKSFDASCAERKRLWLAGASGWWAAGNTSKLVWEPRRTEIAEGGQAQLNFID